MAETRTTWTDERLDDLGRGVEHGFQSVDADLRSINGRMDAGFHAVNARMDEGFHAVNARMDEGFRAANARMDDGFRAVNARIDGFQRSMFQLMGGMMATTLATLITVILTRG